MYCILVGGLQDEHAVWLEDDPQTIDVRGQTYERSTILLGYQVLRYYKLAGTCEKIAASVLSERLRVAAVAGAEKMRIE